MSNLHHPNGDPGATIRTETDSYRHIDQICAKHGVATPEPRCQPSTATPLPVAHTMERNFPANIITIIDMQRTLILSTHDVDLLLAKIRRQAELAMLQIDRHNQGLDYSSVATMAAYEGGAGHIKS